MDSAFLVALGGLHRTPAKTLAKAAVAELLHRQVLEPAAAAGTRRLRRSRVPGLAEGTGAAPEGELLGLVLAVLRSVPTQEVDSVTVREVRAVAQRLAGQSRQLVAAGLKDLAAAGLVEQERRKRLGVAYTTWRRTAAGDALHRDRAPAGDGVPVVVVGDDTSAGTRPHHDVDGGFDRAFGSSFDSGFDGGGGDGGGGGGGD